MNSGGQTAFRGDYVTHVLLAGELNPVFTAEILKTSSSELHSFSSSSFLSSKLKKKHFALQKIIITALILLSVLGH